MKLDIKNLPLWHDHDIIFHLEYQTSSYIDNYKKYELMQHDER